MDTTTVVAARAGDVAAYGRLVDRYAPLAAAVALARTGRPEVAEEVAQEAFLAAWRLLPGLREPEAFGAWLRRIVVKHADRVTRRKHRDTEPLDAVPAPAGGDPEDEAQAAAERRGMLRALARLPDHQREVCALFYLSGRSHAEIAGLLGLSVSAVKKRLHDARRRLLPTVEAPMTWNPAALPLRVRALVAARAGRTDVLSDALNADPDLIGARLSADDEALRTRYVPAGPTLLLEAVGYGNTEAVALLLDRGASLDGALLVAVEQDHPDVVRLLLERGADPNVTRWHGGTSLHIAARRGRRELVELLLAHGADPDVLDAFGHTAADWQLDEEHPAPVGRVIDPSGRGLDGLGPLRVPERIPSQPDLRVRETGIKALDVLAPMTRTGIHRLLAGAGVGKIVLIGELARNLGPVVVAGLLDRTWDVRDFESVLRELGAWDGAVVVLGADASDPAALVRTALALAEERGGLVVADDRLVQELRAAGPGVPIVAFGPHVHPETLPDAAEVDAQWVLDPERARRREYPAVDVAHSTSAAEVSDRHAAIAEAVRATIAGGGPRAERLLAWLTQPFRCAVDFNGRPGVQVAVHDALDDAEALLSGAADDADLDSLRYRGTLAGAGWPTAPGGLF